MKNQWVIGFLAGLLMVGFAASAAEKASFETAKGKALGLHRSLIGYASPPVKVKISGSAQAARDYLAKCGKACELHAFLTKDIQRRFPRATGHEFQLLEALVFAETLKELSQLDQLDLQDKLQKQQQLIQTISNISKNEHDTLKAIIQNLRG